MPRKGKNAGAPAYNARVECVHASLAIYRNSKRVLGQTIIRAESTFIRVREINSNISDVFFRLPRKPAFFFFFHVVQLISAESLRSVASSPRCQSLSSIQVVPDLIIVLNKRHNASIRQRAFGTCNLRLTLSTVASCSNAWYCSNRVIRAALYAYYLTCHGSQGSS